MQIVKGHLIIPQKIIDLYTDVLRAVGGKEIIEGYNRDEHSIELFAKCHHEDHEKARAQVLRALKPNKMFECIYPTELDGTLIEEKVIKLSKPTVSKKSSPKVR